MTKLAQAAGAKASVPPSRFLVAATGTVGDDATITGDIDLGV